MTDNIVEFPSGKKEGGGASLGADEALAMATGRFDEVIIIGIRDDNAQCISTVPIKDAIYEMSRANYILHNYIDRLE